MALGEDMKLLAKRLLPPLIVELAARHRSAGSVWSGDYGSWADATADSIGYDSDVILERVREAALKVKRGEAVYERDSVLFEEIEYSWPTLAALLWIAARNGGRLDVLDFGGALGSTYQQNRRFLAALAEVRWSVVEQPRLVACGKQLFADEQLRFYESIDACLAERAPQVVLLSSVLQYLEQPHALLQCLRDRFPLVVLDLTPVAAEARDRLTVQTVPPSIYPARYPCWIFSEELLLAELKRHFDVVAEFDSHLGQDIRIGRRRVRYRGFILARRGTTP
ncbi:MAG: hypothetical protein JWM53_2641 [bacterium]|nr:hypothetical protein [bacterium]